MMMSNVSLGIVWIILSNVKPAGAVSVYCLCDADQWFLTVVDDVVDFAEFSRLSYVRGDCGSDW